MAGQPKRRERERRKRGPEAYKTPLVRARIAQEVKEPYRTLLLVHAGVNMSREALATTTLGSVEIAQSRVLIDGKALSRDAAANLVEYLRGWRAKVLSTYLFPLPSDSDRPANATVAKRQLARITNNGPRT